MKARSVKKRRTGGHVDGILRPGMMASSLGMSSLWIVHGAFGYLGVRWPFLRLRDAAGWFCHCVNRPEEHVHSTTN